MPPAPFIGRAAQLAELMDAWASRRPGIILITGEAGSGKSRLVAEFLDRLDPSATPILRGAARSVGAAPHDWLASVLSGRSTAGLPVEAALLNRLAQRSTDRTPDAAEPRLAPAATLRAAVEVVRALLRTAPGTLCDAAEPLGGDPGPVSPLSGTRDSSSSPARPGSPPSGPLHSSPARPGLLSTDGSGPSLSRDGSGPSLSRDSSGPLRSPHDAGPLLPPDNAGSSPSLDGSGALPSDKSRRSASGLIRHFTKFADGSDVFDVPDAPSPAGSKRAAAAGATTASGGATTADGGAAAAHGGAAAAHGGAATADGGAATADGGAATADGGAATADGGAAGALVGAIAAFGGVATALDGAGTAFGAAARASSGPATAFRGPAAVSGGAANAFVGPTAVSGGAAAVSGGGAAVSGGGAALSGGAASAAGGGASASGGGELGVVVVEDLHDLDPASLALVAELAAAAPSLPALLLVTSRPPQEAAFAPAAARTLRRLGGGHSVLRMHLAPFTPREAAELIEAAYGSAPAPEAVRGVLQRTGGNPFWLTELLAAYDTADDLAAAPLPAHVVGLLVEPLSGEPALVGRVARAAALLGDPVESDVLLHVCGGDVEPALRRLLDLGMLLIAPDRAPAGSLRFRHPLLREALAAGAMPGERSRVHSLARGLAIELGDDAALARHTAALGYTGEARAAAARGAVASLAAGLPEVALELAALGLSLPTGGHRMSTPAGGHRTSIPADRHQTSVPADGHRTSIPADGHRTSIPADRHRTSIPADGHKASIAADEHGAPIAADEHPAAQRRALLAIAASAAFVGARFALAADYAADWLNEAVGAAEGAGFAGVPGGTGIIRVTDGTIKPADTTAKPANATAKPADATVNAADGTVGAADTTAGAVDTTARAADTTGKAANGITRAAVDEVADAHRQLAAVRWCLGDPSGHQRSLDRAAAVGGSPASLARQRAAEAESALRTEDPAAALPLAEVALAAAERAGVGIGSASVTLGTALALTGAFERGTALLRAARQLADREQDPVTIGRAVHNLVAVSLPRLGDVMGWRLFDEALAAIGRYGLEFCAGRTTSLGVAHALRTGDLARAEALVWSRLPIEGGPVERIRFTARAGLLALERGDDPLAVRMLARADAEGRDSGLVRVLRVAVAARGVHPADPAEALRDCVGRCRPARLAEAARWALHGGVPAAVVAEHVTERPAGLRLLLAVAAGRDADAVDMLPAALGAGEAGDRVEEAAVHTAVAHALVRLGRAGEARRHAERAVALLAHWPGWRLAEAETLLHSLRAGGDLTARELEVLGCIAAGMTNQQVASSLGISIRTVAVHVSNLLRKTGAASRTEAALWAVRHRLAPER